MHGSTVYVLRSAVYAPGSIMHMPGNAMHATGNIGARAGDSEHVLGSGVHKPRTSGFLRN